MYDPYNTEFDNFIYSVRNNCGENDDIYIFRDFICRNIEWSASDDVIAEPVVC